jgi:tetratricopeptide (TPR) repeat protein
MRQGRFVIAAAALVAIPFTSSHAQTARADSLLNAGALQRAESLYYSAVQARPRDPMARWALGKYLVSRGAPRVGMTLFEEALQFGGNPSVVNADLAPTYLSLGEYHKLSALKSSPLSPPELERARWLVAHSTKLIAPDSVSTLTYRKSSDTASLGRVTIRVNGRALEAAIATHERGIIISDTSAVVKRLRLFKQSGARVTSTGAPAVADSIGLGQISLADYPVSVQPLANKQQALIGLDVIARFAPTFDPNAERLTLHTAGTVPRSVSGVDELPTLLMRNDLRVLRAGGWSSLDQPQIRQMLARRRWTFDARRGQLTIDR